jgi:phytoene dehydrogenase-like protein
MIATRCSMARSTAWRAMANSWALKPGNRSRQVRGLYVAGGAAHPSPGMPMVMMSGWIAADVLDTDLKPESLRNAP